MDEKLKKALADYRGAQAWFRWAKNPLAGSEPPHVLHEDFEHAKTFLSEYAAGLLGDPPQYVGQPPLKQQQQQHPDDAAVDRFAVAMKDKLAKAREKGRSGWETCPPDDLSRMLREHVEKGDPRDVANFAMMLWNLGTGIAAAPQPAQPTESILIDGVAYAVPEEVALEMLNLHIVIKTARAQPAQHVQGPVAWLKRHELADLQTCNHRRLGADSPRIWAPNAPDAPPPELDLVAVYTAAQPEAVQEPVAWSDAKQSELNDWFLSLPTGRQAVLLEDKWMLAGAAFLAGKSITPPAAPVHTVVDNEAKSKEKPAETPADTGFERGGQLAPVQDQLAAQGLKEGS